MSRRRDRGDDLASDDVLKKIVNEKKTSDQGDELPPGVIKL